jgi:sterol desaturase/sphingolipid hydroxylase (fatty acid hydroxylase superfamily)
MHDPRLFRRVHRLHHKSHNPSPFTAYSFDVPEAAIHGVFVTVAIVFIPVSQLAIFIFLGHMIVRNVIGHSGYELFPARRDGRPLFGFLTTVTHHDLHHAQAGWNYGLYFTFWDRLMKTEHPLYYENFAAAVRKPLDGSAVGALAPSPASKTT